MILFTSSCYSKNNCIIHISWENGDVLKYASKNYLNLTEKNHQESKLGLENILTLLKLSYDLRLI